MSRTHYFVTSQGVQEGRLIHYSTDGTITFQTQTEQIVQGRVEDFHTNQADAKRAYRRRSGIRIPALSKRMN